MRLIDADALKEEVKTMLCPDGYKIMMLERIESAPAVIKCSMTSDGLPLMDLRPRPQGEWIKDNSGNRFCSECGSSALYHEIGLKIESRFCPNCGADMKGGAE